MRTPVKQLHGKPKVKKETIEDVLCVEIAKFYTVARQKSFSFTDGAGQKQELVVDIVLPKDFVIVEVQKKQDNKAIFQEMAMEKIARDHGWSVCRFSEKEILGDIDTVLYKIRREIERRMYYSKK